jgi:Holliday junction resolvase
MSAYKKGAFAEWYISRLLKEKGFFVIRSAGSRGPIDLLAANKDKIIAIQVKKASIAEHEKEALIKIASLFKAEPMIASKINKRWVLKRADEGG